MGAIAPPGSEFESFWNALVGSAGDESGSTDRTLIEYYRLVVSPTILGIEDGSSKCAVELYRHARPVCAPAALMHSVASPLTTDCASQFYKGVASTATQQDQAAMMHAVLAVSAQHLSNFARAFNNLDKAVSFNEQAAHHRSEALYLLRVSSKSTSPEANEALLPSVTLLLTLSSVLKGDPDIIPSFLDQTQMYLDQIEHPSPAPHLPTICSIYSIYRVLQAIASSQPLDLGSVFQLHEPRDTWVRVADETVERLVGIVSPLALRTVTSQANDLDTRDAPPLRPRQQPSPRVACARGRHAVSRRRPTPPHGSTLAMLDDPARSRGRLHLVWPLGLFRT